MTESRGDVTQYQERRSRAHAGADALYVHEQTEPPDVQHIQTQRFGINYALCLALVYQRAYKWGT